MKKIKEKINENYWCYMEKFMIENDIIKED